LAAGKRRVAGEKESVTGVIDIRKEQGKQGRGEERYLGWYIPTLRGRTKGR